MAVHSGRFGVVNGVSTVGEWSIADAGTLAEAVASNTAFGTARRPGVEEWSGSYQPYGYAPPSGQMPGDSISFIGYMAPDNDQGGVGEEYSGTAMLKQLAVNWNWASGEIISFQTDFDGHLALTPTPATGPHLDSSVPSFPQIGGTFFSYATVSPWTSYTTWTDLVSATWTLKNNVQPYVNSSTWLGTPGRFWTGRKQGIYDWTLAVTEQNVDRARFKKGDQLALRLYVTQSLYWELWWGMVRDFTNIVVDRKTGKIITQTINIDMQVSDVTAGTLGHILKPDGTTWWPIAQT
jgi:hypothetical protein